MISSWFVEDFISGSPVFWSGDDYFSKRNLQKISKALSRIRSAHPDLSLQEMASEISDAVSRRTAKIDSKIVYIISKGGSGCHYLGGLLSNFEDFKAIDEVYFPDYLLSLATNAGLPGSAEFIELVNFFHMGMLRNHDNITPVNLMHLRFDMQPSLIHRLDPRSKFIFLVRNPVDIAISRGLRKENYRLSNSAFKDLTEAEFFSLQVNNVKSHFDRLQMQVERVENLIIRYEDLIDKPSNALKEALDFCDLKVGHSEVKERLSMGQSSETTSNLNEDPKPELSAEQNRIIDSVLKDTSIDWGYN